MAWADSPCLLRVGLLLPAERLKQQQERRQTSDSSHGQPAAWEFRDPPECLKARRIRKRQQSGYVASTVGTRDACVGDLASGSAQLLELSASAALGTVCHVGLFNPFAWKT